MNISIGNDHAGVDYKNYIIKNLEEKYNIVNHGTDDINSVDYPDFAHPVSLDIDNRKVIGSIDLWKWKWSSNDSQQIQKSKSCIMLEWRNSKACKTAQ